MLWQLHQHLMAEPEKRDGNGITSENVEGFAKSAKKTAVNFG
jgi:hypothetical protein